MAINDVYRAVATFTLIDAQIAQWVWHYVQTLSGTPDHALLVAAVKTAFTAAFTDIDDHIDNGVIGNTLEMLLWDSVLNQFDGVASIDISAAVGLNVGDSLPQNVAPFVGFHTALPRSRGKKFIFGWAEGAQSDGQISALPLADLATFAAAFDNTVTAGGITFNPGNFNLPTEVFRQWTQTTISVGLFSGSQYRRLPGRGA